LAELISDLLSVYADQNDIQEYQRYQSLYQNKLTEYRKLKEQKERIVSLRNRVDHIEQKACELREDWEKYFITLSVKDVNDCEMLFKQYCTTYDLWDKSKNSFFGKLFWFVIGKRKTSDLNSKLQLLNECFNKYNLSIELQSADLLDSKSHKKICDLGKNLVYSLKTICEYKDVLNNLISAPKLEEVDRDLIKIKSNLANIADKLWDKWLTTRPLDINTTCRKEMNEYVSSMRLIGDVDLSDYPEIRKKFNELQKKMTSFLPCWAVTSLSAKGKVPFIPGVFDLVVIDEASQCDIASVLPMLYRAKRAVIIGDPKQLSHISTISKAQDLSLLQKYNVNMIWSYSANSLYEMASSLSQPSQIIQLKDHHRSVGDIIEFSNAEFYDSKLRIATKYDRLNCPKNYNLGISWIDVAGKIVRPTAGSAYNDAEVALIVEEIKRLVLNDHYKGTVGVVTPFRAQADRISKAFDAYPELKNALRENNFLVDTVHKFQGDERDLMFFSPVISDGTPQGPLSFLKSTGNLFNVAITRARAVLIVVGNHRYCSTCGITYMEHFVEHVDRLKLNPKNTDIDEKCYSSNRMYPHVDNPEQVSDWERLFYTALYDRGIFTIPQYSVEKYKLDFAIIDGKRKLDIEID
jgi:hypothetical protein